MTPRRGLREEAHQRAIGPEWKERRTGSAEPWALGGAVAQEGVNGEADRGSPDPVRWRRREGTPARGWETFGEAGRQGSTGSGGARLPGAGSGHDETTALGMRDPARNEVAAGNSGLGSRCSSAARLRCGRSEEAAAEEDSGGGGADLARGGSGGPATGSSGPAAREERERARWRLRIG